MKTPLICAALKDMQFLQNLDLGTWDELVRQGRRGGLIARLAVNLQQADCWDVIPEPVRWHFTAALALAERQQIAVRWEVMQIQQALGPSACPIILLKGASYVMAELPAARGRLFNDIDILVPRERLAEVEAALMLVGWHVQAQDAYDERYYRQWMHEIPPMQHVKRGSVLDVHHAILPHTARYHPDPAKLRAAAVPVPGEPDVWVLAPVDMVLHSACHLFHDGELTHGLRDLSDLNLLLRHFPEHPGFWERLPQRAAELELTRPLYYALRYVRHFFQTPIPPSVDVALKEVAPGVRPIMDAMFHRVLGPDHASYDDGFAQPARLAAYVRAHWLRMPLRLLIPHLLHKALIKPKEELT
ncbi:MAG: nucleotidyltransferase family protein [Thiobacillaceae bacterium]